MRQRAMAIVGLVALLGVACGGGASSGAGGSAGGGSTGRQEVAVQGLDTLKFNPATLTVRTGSPVHLTLNNTGALVHDWVVDSLEGSRVAVQADGGKSASVDFTPTRAGTYQFYCSQPGHREAGMVGTLTVQ